MKLTSEIVYGNAWEKKFFDNGVEIGYMFMTSHPIIPYEVYFTETLENKRVMTELEAENWLISKMDNV